MNWFVFTLASPLLAGLLLALVRQPLRASAINIACSVFTLGGSVVLAIGVMRHGGSEALGGFFFLDSYNVFLITLTSFVSLTTAIYSGPYMRHEWRQRQLPERRLRLYHCMFQLFVFGMLLGFTTNNIGLMWIALELATLATVMLVSLYRTPASIAAAWKYFMLAGMGIALALFGTILIFLSSSQLFGHSNDALTWTLLFAHAGELEPTVMMMAFAFLMVGYGTKVGLAPMHAWLPDAHGEGPTPVSAVLSGLLLNLALYALVRFKMLVDGATGSDMAGHIMIAFGVLSLCVAAISLHKQHDIKRMFSFSSIEHMGLMTIAFGIGTPLAVFAGLLHMTVHSLIKTGIFFSVGYAAQAMGSQQMDQIRGLIRHHPGIGWALLIGTAAIAGFPPFGVFASEFLLFSAALETYPGLLAILLIALLVAFAGLFRFVQPMVFGPAPEHAVAVKVNMLPIYIHFSLALLLGLAIPGPLASFYDQAAHLIAAESSSAAPLALFAAGVMP